MAVHNIKMRKKNKTDWDILYPITLASNVNLSNGQTVQYELDTIFNKTATSSKNGAMSSTDKAKLDGIEANANRYVHPNDANTRHVTDKQMSVWNDKYTKLEIDNKFNELNTGLDWKESVATFNDIATTYPNPQDGWTVNTKDTDITYRYTGTTWIAISANAIPMASQTTDGKMSKADKKILDNLNVKVADLERDMGSLGEGMTGDLSKLINRITTAENNIKGIDVDITSLQDNKSDVNHTHNYAGASSSGGAANSALACTGNSATATKLATARSIAVAGDITGSASFDGSAGISISSTLANSGVTAGSYGPTGNVSASFGGTITIPQITVDAKGRVTSAAARTITLPTVASVSDTKVTNTLATTTKAYITGTTSSTTNTGTQVFDTGVYLDTTAGMLTATTFKGSLSGNASTATTLASARLINGTSFNGSSDITTEKWGKARTITIGTSSKTIDGSQDISWSLDELGLSSSGGGEFNGFYMRRYALDIGDGTSTTIKVTHSLETEDVTVTVREISTKQIVTVDAQIVDSNSINLLFNNAPAAGAYRVIIIG